MSGTFTMSYHVIGENLTEEQAAALKAAIEQAQAVEGVTVEEEPVTETEEEGS